MASLKDVAKLANVSLMTVSRALNTPERLKPETLARVQQAIDQTNYVPDLSAKKNTWRTCLAKNHRRAGARYGDDTFSR
jgi:transcriptional regulator, LacI family